MSPVWRRILGEHRLYIAVIVGALAVNLGVFAAVVYPLERRVADADNRAAMASRAVRDARRELDAAAGIASSRDRAVAELQTFYRDVLPADVDAAHKLTYLDLAVRARRNDLRIARRTATAGRERGSRFGRLTVSLVLEGEYDDMRRFVNEIERAPGFLVIDQIAMDQGRGQGALVMTMQLSTYYRMTGDAG
jgi:Tfp pilus assembly protein PilO